MDFLPMDTPSFGIDKVHHDFNALITPAFVFIPHSRGLSLRADAQAMTDDRHRIRHHGGNVKLASTGRRTDLQAKVARVVVHRDVLDAAAEAGLAVAPELGTGRVDFEDVFLDGAVGFVVKDQADREGEFEFLAVGGLGVECECVCIGMCEWFLVCRLA